LSNLLLYISDGKAGTLCTYCDHEVTKIFLDFS